MLSDWLSWDTKAKHTGEDGQKLNGPAVMGQRLNKALKTSF